MLGIQRASHALMCNTVLSPISIRRTCCEPGCDRGSQPGSRQVRACSQNGGAVSSANGSMVSGITYFYRAKGMHCAMFLVVSRH